MKSLSTRAKVCFQRICGEYTFTADFNGEWHLCLSSQYCLNTTDDDDESSSDNVLSACHWYSIYHRDYDACNEDDCDRSAFEKKDANFPCILATLDGIPDSSCYCWSEHEVRRFSLITKLFGEDAAGTGM